MKNFALILGFLACAGCNVSFIGGGLGDMAPTQDCGKEITACGCWGANFSTTEVYYTPSCESGQAFADQCAETCADGSRAMRRVCSCD